MPATGRSALRPDRGREGDRAAVPPGLPTAPAWRSGRERTAPLGPAGRFARAWISSKLTPLIIAGSLLIGAFAVWKLPREEEPQIIVPMIDVFVQMPGASAREVEERVTKPMEKLLWEIPGVEYIYSTSSPGMSLAIVRFYVGQDEEKSIVRLNQKLHANFDLIPPGAIAAAGQAALHRRCADPGADALQQALRRFRAAAASPRRSTTPSSRCRTSRPSR